MPIETASSKNQDILVWRYMDFTKFMSMLLTKSLFFSRSDLLGDPWEGSYTLGNLNPENDTHFLPNEEVGSERFKKFLSLRKSIRNMTKQTRVINFISCWHMSECESAALWKLYSEEKNSICIQSSYSILAQLLKEANPSAVFGAVRYLDYQNLESFIKEFDSVAPFLHKRKSFEYEREIRIIIEDPPHHTHSGISLTIDLERLIQKVYVSPTSPGWFTDILIKVCGDYRIDPAKVTQSDLKKDPIW